MPDNERKSTTKRNQSLGKAFQIIEVMADAPGPMRLQEIAAALDLPGSTALRFLKTLMDYNYVGQNQDSLQYYLTMKFCRIADRVTRQVQIRDIVHPYLLELARSFGEATSLAVEQDNLVVYIDVVEGPDHMLRTLQRIGKIAPMHSTGVGKVLLSGAPEEHVDRVIKEKGFTAPTEYTITSMDTLRSELENIKKQGYALDMEECEMGVRCAAAPLRDFSGKIVAAISTSGPIGRMTQEKLDSIIEEITSTAGEISQKLGYMSS